MMAISIKEALKPLLPRPVLERWQRLRFNAEQAAARDRPLDHVFNEIYAKGMWRPEGAEAEFHSGPGSLAPVTAGYEAFVAGILDSDPAIETLVDIGCGDFQVSQRILGRVKGRSRTSAVTSLRLSWTTTSALMAAPAKSLSERSTSPRTLCPLAIS